MGVCSLRILTAQWANGAHHNIPLSDWKSYAVAQDIGGSQAFTVQACMVESEKGKLLGWGATPSAIKEFLQHPDYRSMHVSSKSGVSYVNIKLKTVAQNSAIKKIEAMVELTPVTGQIYSAVKFMKGLFELNQESEVEFTITAVATDDTKYSFKGEQTLLQVYYEAAKAKAFSCADKSIVQKAAAVGELVANALGPAGGVVADAVGAIATIAEPAANLVSAVVRGGV